MMVGKSALVLLFIFSISYVSALGISPAIKNIDFVPGQEVNITFYVLDAVEYSTYDVGIRGGDLADYSSLNVDSVKGNGVFILTIKFPTDFDKPGTSTISVSVKERPSESSFINTVVEVGSTVKTFVPYPGYYGDLSLSIPDGNVDENIPVELHVINRGDNPLNIESVFVDFVSGDGNAVKKIEFTPVNIPIFGERYFRKYLDTTGIVPGNYIGRARVSYEGITREVNKSFRVGSLFVNITNFTNYVLGGGIQKFYVTLENKWNSKVLGAYVDVNLTNDIYSMVFRTPSIDLEPWEEKVIESYLDTDNLEGKYNLFLNASYHGQSTFIYGSLFVGKDYSLIIYSVSAIVAIIFFIVLYFILKRLFFRNKRR
ncbi:MAG: hypothetical protein AABX23_01980 [Nanoarchaeota archaeon]